LKVSPPSSRIAAYNAVDLQAAVAAEDQGRLPFFALSGPVDGGTLLAKSGPLGLQSAKFPRETASLTEEGVSSEVVSRLPSLRVFQRLFVTLEWRDDEPLFDVENAKETRWIPDAAGFVSGDDKAEAGKSSPGSHSTMATMRLSLFQLSA
jgi:hypothetical protein